MLSPFERCQLRQLAKQRKAKKREVLNQLDAIRESLRKSMPKYNRIKTSQDC